MNTLATTLAAAAASLALAAPAVAQDGVVVADRLNNPRQLDVQPNGSVFVAEAGRGGDRCKEIEPGFVGCLGFTSAITRVAPGPTKRVVTSLLSTSGEDGAFASGATAVAYDPRGGFVAIQNGTPPEEDLFSDSAATQNGALLRTNLFQPRTVIRQVDDFEYAENPANDQVESNPYGVEATREGFYVADAAGNSLVFVPRDRRRPMEAVATFEDIGGGDPVPTSVRQGPDGALYVGTLAEAAGPGGAVVYRVVPGEEPTVHADGLTTVVGLDFDSEGNLYVAELFNNTVTRVDAATGEHSTIGEGQLLFPGGVAVGEDDSIYVSNMSVIPAFGEPFGPGSRGQVLRFGAQTAE